MTDDGHPVRQQDFSFPVTLNGRSVEEGLVEELETLSKKEREIIAYLYHKQQMFTCAIDGGHAATLISRGIVRRALNQVFEFDDMPVKIPLEVWRFLRENVDQFPYEGDEDELETWRKAGWNERRQPEPEQARRVYCRSARPGHIP